MVPGIAEFILNADTQPARFERFCADICGAVEGVIFVTTSSNYDRGRDARSLGKSRGTHAHVVCATLTADLDDKTTNDIVRLTETSTPDRVLYCCAQHITEDKIDKLGAELRPLLPPGCSLGFLGSIQLADLAERFPDSFQRHYATEVRTIEQSLKSFEERDDESRTRSLKLALLAFGSADAVELRSTMTRGAVLGVIRELTAATVPQISKRLSDDLRLSRLLSATFISATLEELAKSGLVTTAQERWKLTAEGTASVDAVPTNAALELLTGSKIVRQRLEELTGVVLADSQFGLLWTTFLDFLSDAFYTNGLSVLHAVREFIVPDEGAVVPRRLQDLIEAGARRVRATITEPQLAEDVEQAVLDMFTERTGPAFEWLARACERFVALCAMGLESSSADEIRNVLRRQLLVIDSDILLTLLNESEPDHRPAKDLIARWRQLGGRILVATPVLAEVARHAWIAEREFKETRFLLGKLRPHELRRYAANAFVRSFHSQVKGPQDGKRWTEFIEQYRGSAAEDYSRLLDLLRDELGVEVLSDTFDAGLKEQMSTYLNAMVANFRNAPVEDLNRKDTDKADRDAQLLSSIAAARQAQHKAGSGQTIVLLSSSVRLRRADNRFRTELGNPPSVIALGPFSYLLSLVPNVALGAGTLRRALFEFGSTANLPDTGRIAFQIIRASDSFDMPWSKRRGLQRNLENVLYTEARKRGMTVNALTKQFDEGDESIKPAEIIATALKESAITDVALTELRQANQTIRSLEDRIEELEAQVRARSVGRKAT